MRKKTIISLVLILILIASALVFWKYWPKKEEEIRLKPATFAQLPGWNSANLLESFNTFKVSCRAFLRQDPERLVGSQFLSMKAKNWQPLCKKAMSMKKITESTVKKFFETGFNPVLFYQGKPVEGLFTGYYSPLLKGSPVQTSEFSVPIYGLPKDMLTVNLGLFFSDLAHRKVVGRIQGKQLIPYYTREEINRGAIKRRAPVLVWIANRIDRLFLEIQGSGAVELPDGKVMYLGYEGENGATYTSVAQVLINQGVMTKHNASMQGIRKYLQEHPDQMDSVMHQNKSFVFFRSLGHDAAYGAQGVVLTPGYSLAVDRKWVPLGTPIWLVTTRPDKHADNKKVLQRLMIAQDTGGAIRGPVRGDVYWGAGKKATFIAGHMKNKGYYWLLLPKNN